MTEIYYILEEEKLYDTLEKIGFCFINNALIKI